MQKLRKILAILLSLACASPAVSLADSTYEAFEASPPNAPRNILVCATGPGLDKDNSLTVRNQTRDLARHLHQQLPGSELHVFDHFDIHQISPVLDAVRQRYGRSVPVTLLINAHGYNLNGQYYVQGHTQDGKPAYFTEQEIATLAKGLNMQLALLTCHSGAVNLNRLNVPVFGPSSNTSLAYESIFTEWLNVVKNSKCSVLSVKEIAESWAQATTNLTGTCLSDQYAWWYAEPKGYSYNIVGQKIASPIAVAA